MQTFIREKTFVDVILPNYNKTEFLEEAINSVITQTYKNWHLYIIDDNSSDNSEKIIDKFSNLKNVTIIKLQKNKGPSFCRNYALRISKSKYISFIDSDDSWLSDKLEKQIAFMEKYNLSFTYTDYTPFFESFGKKKITKSTKILKNIDLDEKFILKTDSDHVVASVTQAMKEEEQPVVEEEEMIEGEEGTEEEKAEKLQKMIDDLQDKRIKENQEAINKLKKSK